MSTIGAAPRAVTMSNARAEASRRNGARSRGPKTPEGKARASRNALKHGLRAAKHLVLPAEDPGAFGALEAALLEELAPEGAIQTVLARQVVSAAWRLARVERMEAELLIFRDRGEGDLGLAATRDANTARALPTLVRYRAAAHAELLRSLRALEALRAERAKRAHAAAAPAAALAPEASGRPCIAEPTRLTPARIAAGPRPKQSGSRRTPPESGPGSDPREPEPRDSTRPERDRRLSEPGAVRNPNEPEARSSRPTLHWLARPRS
jgi:hypothetical protein